MDFGAFEIGFFSRRDGRCGLVLGGMAGRTGREWDLGVVETRAATRGNQKRDAGEDWVNRATRRQWISRVGKNKGQGQMNVREKLAAEKERRQGKKKVSGQRWILRTEVHLVIDHDDRLWHA